MTPPLAQQAIEAFEGRFGTRASTVAFAPGRVELLGNHTDYNGGFVLSVALDRGIAMAADAPESRGAPPVAHVWSESFAEESRFALDEIVSAPASWSNYVRGTLLELQKTGVQLAHFRAAIVSDLPLGAGVSSSAALELATAEAVRALFGGGPSERMELAELCQRAEVSFVGMPCGLLDQFSSAFGKAGYALFLDCDTLAHDRVKLGDDVRIVLADSDTRHALVDGRYAELRQSCEKASAHLGELLGRPIRCLREVSSAELVPVAERLPPGESRRARHVVQENERVLAGVEALRRGDVGELGRLMLASHASCRELLGNSTPELDFLVEAASRHDGLIGAKLCGGGFGGSTVNLVRAGSEEAFVEDLAKSYRDRYDRSLRTVIAGVGDGSRSFPVETVS